MWHLFNGGHWLRREDFIIILILTQQIKPDFLWIGWNGIQNLNRQVWICSFNNSIFDKLALLYNSPWASLCKLGIRLNDLNQINLVALEKISSGDRLGRQNGRFNEGIVEWRNIVLIVEHLTIWNLIMPWDIHPFPNAKQKNLIQPCLFQGITSWQFYNSPSNWGTERQVNSIHP